MAYKHTHMVLILIIAAHLSSFGCGQNLVEMELMFPQETDFMQLAVDVSNRQRSHFGK